MVVILLIAEKKLYLFIDYVYEKMRSVTNQDVKCAAGDVRQT